jgi:phenylpropionate dioxygenase-like ring-hydroxylating dioxygenase large terminal subunit
MPFLRNVWYVAAYASEVGDDLFHRRILNEPVLLYRGADGAVRAIGDRCPHRFAPLHLGARDGDDVVCAYHGLRFDQTGACVFNPHGNQKIPVTARVPRYPVVERDGLIWIWPGDPDRADASAIVDFSYLGDPACRTIGGYLRIDANYELMADNLMDLSHTQFLHVEFQKLDWFEGHHSVRHDGSTISAAAWLPNSRPTPMQARVLAPDARVDAWLEVEWHAPGLVKLNMGAVPPGSPRPEISPTRGTHLLTPESESVTHYFYGNTRNFNLDDPAIDERTMMWQRIGFDQQDRPMLEAVSAMMNGRTDLFEMNPVLLESDAAAIRVRRTLAGLIDAENHSVVRA